MSVNKIREVGCALVVLLVAGCGSPHLATRQASPTSLSTTTSTEVEAVTAASNKAKAEAEAVRLLGLVVVPPGSVRFTGAPPAALAYPANGTPGSRSLVDRTAFWTVPMSMDAAIAWFGAHPVPGLGGSTGGGTSSTRGVITMQSLAYRDPSSDAWTQAGVGIGVTPLGKSSSLARADSQTLWIDPVPIRDDQRGPRVHVDVASGCPASAGEFVGVTNPGPPLNDSLVPSGAPTAGLVCEYLGMNGDAFAFKQRTELNSTAAAAFAKRFQQTPLGHVDGSAAFCPMDDKSVTVVALVYPDHRNVDLWMETTGCSSVSNGYITASTMGLDLQR